MIVALLDHLWQSSLFAGGAWLVARSLRGHAARLRFAVWLMASCKFLLPFSLLAAAGASLRTFGISAELPVLANIQEGALAHLAMSPVRSVDPQPLAAGWLLRFAGVAWTAGFAVLIARWGARWLHLRAILKTSVHAPIAAPIRARYSPRVLEPGVVGVFRPVLLLPANIHRQLAAAQFEAVVQHELAHVRRRDNLTAAIHMLAEAVFWFFPPVWWIGARMLEERERACDEAVVRAGHDPRVYAEGILEVCRAGCEAELPCVSGVSGADLKNRLEAIMTNREFRSLSRARQWLLGTIAVSSFAAPVALGLLVPSISSASPAAAAAAGSSAPTAQIARIELLPGNHVKLDYRDVDVRALLAAMAEAARVNMLVSDQVSGKVTVNLAETTWERALDIILQAEGLEKHEKDGILFIEPAKLSQAR